MRYLVSGGSGFIGSHIVEALLGRGEQVRVLDNFSTGKPQNIANLKGSLEIIEGDIRSYHIVREAVDGVDIVLHQAALPSVPRSIRDPITSNDVNAGGTLNMLDAARDAGVRRFVFASSSSIYGDSPTLSKEESMTPNPLSPYAVSKLAAENYCRVFSAIYGLHTVSLRYFNVFGPRQDPHSEYSAVIPKFIKMILADQRPVIFGDGEQTRDFTYVANVVRANILAAHSDCPPGIVVNCACHERTTLNEVVDGIAHILGKSVVPEYQQARSGDVKHSFASIERAKTHLRYDVVCGFKEGLRKTIEFYRGT